MEKAQFSGARVLYYSLLSKFFIFTEDLSRFDNLLQMLNLISNFSLNDEMKNAILHINQKLNGGDFSVLEDEYNAIFHTPPSPVRNSFSYYDEGYEIGRACVLIRKILANTDIRRDETKFKENEDNVGFVFALMASFIQRATEGDKKFDELEVRLFKEIINLNIDEFLEAVFIHQNSEIYKEIFVIANNFIEFERVILGIEKPIKSSKNKKSYDGISRSEKIRRDKNRSRKSK